MDPCPGCWPPACPRPNISKFQSLAHGCTSHLFCALYILLTCCRWQIDSMCFTSESKVVCLLFRFLWENLLSHTPGRFGQCLFSWTVAECHSTRGPLTVHHTPESVVDCIVAPLPRGSNPFLMNSLPHRPPKLVGCWDKSSLFYQTSKHVRFWFGRKAKQKTMLNHSSANSAKSCPRIPFWFIFFFTIHFFESQLCSYEFHGEYSLPILKFHLTIKISPDCLLWGNSDWSIWFLINPLYKTIWNIKVQFESFTVNNRNNVFSNYVSKTHFFQ